MGSRKIVSMFNNNQILIQKKISFKEQVAQALKTTNQTIRQSLQDK